LRRREGSGKQVPSPRENSSTETLLPLGTYPCFLCDECRIRGCGALGLAPRSHTSTAMDSRMSDSGVSGAVSWFSCERSLRDRANEKVGSERRKTLWFRARRAASHSHQTRLRIGCGDEETTQIRGTLNVEASELLSSHRCSVTDFV
jgi:hypothetical protein